MSTVSLHKIDPTAHFTIRSYARAITGGVLTSKWRVCSGVDCFSCTLDLFSWCLPSSARGRFCASITRDTLLTWQSTFIAHIRELTFSIQIIHPAVAIVIVTVWCRFNRIFPLIRRTLVQKIQLNDVDLWQSWPGSYQISVIWVFGFQGEFSFSKGTLLIMHDTQIIEWSPQRVDCVSALFFKLWFEVFRYVFPRNREMLISIWARLLMVKTWNEELTSA